MLSIMNEIDPCLLLPLCVLYEIQNQIYQHDLLLGLELKKALEDRGDPNDPRVRLKHDCVGIMAAFKLKDLPDHVVIVANTHLYW